MAVVLLLIVAVLAVVVFVVIAVTTVLTVVSTVRRRGDWGVNFRPPGHCPRCGAGLPTVRAPGNSRQFFWGGWTCEQCGAEIDKWGNVL